MVRSEPPIQQFGHSQHWGRFGDRTTSSVLGGQFGAVALCLVAGASVGDRASHRPAGHWIGADGDPKLPNTRSALP